MTTTKNTTTKKFLLVAIGLGQNKIVKEGSIIAVQLEKKKLSALPLGKIIFSTVRTPEGYKALKVLKNKGEVK